MNSKIAEKMIPGSDNAEHEIRKAYNCVIESGVTYSFEHRHVPGVDPHEATDLYRKAFNAFRRGNRLASERWARSAKHLARAFWHEAKIAYLEPRSSDLPFLTGASSEEYNLYEHSDTTADLLDSVATHIPAGAEVMPTDMSHYLARARKHLQTLDIPTYEHELLRAERIKAAYEYGRVLECMALAYEAEAEKAKVAA